MSRTEDRFYADRAHNGGLIHVDAGSVPVFRNDTGALLGATRQAGPPIVYTVSLTASQACDVVLNFGDAVLRRLIESYQAEGAFQEQFNMAPPTPGRPPFTGINELVVPSQAGPPKGIQVDSIYVVYTVITNSLASIVALLNEYVYTDGATPVVTNFPVTAVSAPLTATTSTNVHVATFNVTTPSFVVDDFSNLQARFTITPGAGGSLIHAVGAHVHFNYD